MRWVGAVIVSLTMTTGCAATRLAPDADVGVRVVGDDTGGTAYMPYEAADWPGVLDDYCAQFGRFVEIRRADLHRVTFRCVNEIAGPASRS